MSSMSGVNSQTACFSNFTVDSASQPEREVCVICQFSLRSVSKGSLKAVCGHIFHTACITSMQEEDVTKCPLCRKDFVVIPIKGASCSDVVVQTHSISLSSLNSSYLPYDLSQESLSEPPVREWIRRDKLRKIQRYVQERGMVGPVKSSYYPIHLRKIRIAIFVIENGGTISPRTITEICRQDNRVLAKVLLKKDKAKYVGNLLDAALRHSAEKVLDYLFRKGLVKSTHVTGRRFSVACRRGYDKLALSLLSIGNMDPLQALRFSLSDKSFRVFDFILRKHYEGDLKNVPLDMVEFSMTQGNLRAVQMLLDYPYPLDIQDLFDKIIATVNLGFYSITKDFLGIVEFLSINGADFEAKPYILPYLQKCPDQINENHVLILEKLIELGSPLSENGEERELVRQIMQRTGAERLPGRSVSLTEDPTRHHLRWKTIANDLRRYKRKKRGCCVCC